MTQTKRCVLDCDWLPGDVIQSIKTAPRNQEWLEKAAYFRWEARQLHHIPGNDLDDWNHALLTLEIRVELFFLELHIKKCADPKERIRFAVL